VSHVNNATGQHKTNQDTLFLAIALPFELFSETLPTSTDSDEFALLVKKEKEKMTNRTNISTKILLLSLLIVAMIFTIGCGLQTSPTPILPTATPTNTLGFVEQESYTEDCTKRPSDSVCLAFSDNYVWLIHDSVSGWNLEAGFWEDKKIEIAQGSRADYYHIIGTNLVKEVPKD
jgi:hypothetical protein